MLQLRKGLSSVAFVSLLAAWPYQAALALPPVAAPVTAVVSESPAPAGDECGPAEEAPWAGEGLAEVLLQPADAVQAECNPNPCDPIDPCDPTQCPCDPLNHCAQDACYPEYCGGGGGPGLEPVG